MKKTITAVLGMLVAALVAANNTPVGLWQTIDDKTGTAKSEVRITERAGVLSGKLEKILQPDFVPTMTCTECTGDRKGQLLLGLEIIRGAKREAGAEYWAGGKILDPESGTEYRLRLTPLEGGKKLEMRGYVGPIWRNQTWIRLQ